MRQCPILIVNMILTKPAGQWKTVLTNKKLCEFDPRLFEWGTADENNNYNFTLNVCQPAPLVPSYSKLPFFTGTACSNKETSAGQESTPILSSHVKAMAGVRGAVVRLLAGKMNRCSYSTAEDRRQLSFLRSKILGAARNVAERWANAIYKSQHFCHTLENREWVEFQKLSSFS